MELDFIDSDRYYIDKQIKQSRDENQFVIIDKKTGKYEFLYFWFHNHKKYQDFCPKYQAYARIENLNKQISIMKQLNHPVILKLINYKIMNSNNLIGCILKTKYPINGCLLSLTNEYLQTNGKNNLKMNPTIRSKIIFGIASLMSYLHTKNIVNTNLLLECIYLDENFEPKILNDCLSKSLYRAKEKDPLYYKPAYDENHNEDFSREKFTDVFSFGLFVNSLFSAKVDDTKSKNELMPDSYWKLVSKCWSQPFYSRPKFDEIVENLQNDEFAIEEFGMKTDIEQLHEYQKRLPKLRKLEENEHNLHLPNQRRRFIGSDNDDDDDDDGIIIEY